MLDSRPMRPAGDYIPRPEFGEGVKFAQGLSDEDAFADGMRKAFKAYKEAAKTLPAHHGPMFSLGMDCVYWWAWRE